MAAAILTNREMLSLVDKVKMVPGLLPMLIEGQDFIDAQDELSVLEFMEKYGMPETVNEEIFIATARAYISAGYDSLVLRTGDGQSPRLHGSGSHVDDGHINSYESFH